MHFIPEHIPSAKSAKGCRVIRTDSRKIKRATKQTKSANFLTLINKCNSK